MLDLWYKSAIIYSLSVGSYQDSNGDGIGDFRGLTDRLDHIAELGANCLWLLPFFRSPRLDFGYDVVDYYNVASCYGTLGDFVEFSRQARQRGMRLLIDLPLNHTSDQHPWFQSARSDADSIYRDYYIWSREKPKNIEDGVVFPGHQEAVWTYDEEARAWYFHRFYKHQPDLNIMNPNVREEFQRIMGFWLELGVSGFRIDAAPFLIEETLPNGTAQPHYDLIEDLRTFLSWRKGDAVMLAEANVASNEITCFIEDRRMQMGFGFLFNQSLFLALARHSAESIRRAIELAPRLSQLGQWVQFLRNHDELDLGRLSEGEREEVFARLSPDPDTHIYHRGIRRRLAPLLGGDRSRIEMAFSLMFTLPGTPVMYYGDEIGMGDDLSEPERWSVRTCMQWTNRPGGGFSTAPQSKLIHPLIHGGRFGVEAVNVLEQQRDPASLLHWMRRLCQLRSTCKEIGWGEMSLIDTDMPAVLAHRFRWRDRVLIVLHNLSDVRCDVTLDLNSDELHQGLLDQFGNQLYEPHDQQAPRFALAGYGYRWLRLRRPLQ